MQLLTGAKRASAVLSTREERALRKEVKKQLIEAEIDDADTKARILVELRATTNALDYLPLLRHQESNFILERAQSIGSLINSTKNIDAAVNRVSKIVTTLKSFSAVDTEDERIEADLKEGIEAALAQYTHQISGRTEVVRQYDALPMLVCLQDELKLVWMHLIHNALQAMDYGGTLTISLKRIGNEAVISVTDNGCGIAEEIRHRIFEAFFSTRPHGEGCGLGLDIAKKIVAKHRGRIEVQTELGLGSTFSVYLPYPSGASVVKTNEQASV
ncbi:MAG: sensor histidine kinase [Burkholderiales bacterium]|nr:sensor histidine kinase [Burkholderiales bacterium]